MKKPLLLKFFILTACLWCALGASAAEAYACYTSSNTTLTFYYDNYRSSRPGRTYNLNTGDIPTAWYNDTVTKAVFDPSFAAFRPTTTYYWFCGLQNLQSITGMSYLNTSEVTNMGNMFCGCKELTRIDLSNFNTSKVTNMVNMFFGCHSLTSLDVSSFNTSQVTNMGTMFYNCSGLKTLDVSNFNTSRVTNMHYMFDDCRALTSLDVSNFNTSRVTDMDHMFDDCRALTSLDLSNFNTENVKDMNGMFSNCSGLTTLDLSNFNTSNVTDMGEMFSGCIRMNSLNLSNFNTTKVTDMHRMFEECRALTSLDLSSFNTSKVTSMSSMFYNSSGLKTIYASSRWSTVAVTESSDMFKNCTSLVGGKSTTYDANRIDKAYAHIDGGTSNPGYLTDIAPMAYACYTSSNTTLTFYYDNQRSSRSGTTYDMNTIWDWPGWRNDGTCSSVTKVVFNSSFADARPISTCYWFNYMQNLQSITGLNYLNTSEVTDMTYMFAGSNKLTSLDVSNFNTSKVTSMRGMFAGCTALTSLDLSNFNTSRVTDMEYMFNNCTNLRTIYAGTGWSTAAVTSSDGMFIYCTNLVGGKGTTFDANHTNKAYAHIDGGTSNPGYFTAAGTEAYACYTPSNTTLTFYYDNLRSSRSGTTYDMNTIWDWPGWRDDGTCSSVTKVVFNSSFAAARPISTCYWFNYMQNLQSITGLSYLNTSEVTDMTYMFYGSNKLTSLDVSNFNTSKVTSMRGMFAGCTALTSLDLSNFNTSRVTDMEYMFNNCTNLRTIYAGTGWSTAAVTSSGAMFYGCTSLVGGKGTTFDANHTDKAYAHIDGGPSNPGYLTDKNAGLRGDVNSDNTVSIADVTALIDYLLTSNASGINLQNADCNNDNSVTIADVTTLIDYLLTGYWSGDHEWVDLGLPSGTLWATCNVGASSPEDYGDYFAWGETSPKGAYNWSTYKWCNGSNSTMTKYCTRSSYGYNGFTDGKTELDPEDDAAYVNWGRSWRMPSIEQVEELVEECVWTWTTRNGVNGRLVTGPNGNTIFLPAAGCYRWEETLYDAGSDGYYWSRTLNGSSDKNADFLFFFSGSVDSDMYNNRLEGYPVRAVSIP